ncbi:unnamed protein product [Camellia sinensis]|uniref:Transcription factor MYB16 n=1 Tax=Camellia sinensis TaxID=4442 RepID=A0A7M4CK31_CAMSI|nr:transcription factor MYB16-like [Camellia sinensis]QOS14582.1 transcription factor MYB16 [Camellia sinensis]
MGRSPCCEKVGLKKGPWTPEEDQKLLAYIEDHGHGSWRALPAKAGLQRCGKSCRLRWTNYLRPDIKRGKFSLQEEQTIIQLHALLGNRWSAIATYLPKRTDNEIKNYWNTHLKKRLTKMGIDPVTHKPKSEALGPGQLKDAANLSHMAQWESARLEAEARLVRESKLHVINPFHSSSAAAPPHHHHHHHHLAPLPPPPPLCLDVLTAWKGSWLKTPKDNAIAGNIFAALESPTSTLKFGENPFPIINAGLFGNNSVAVIEQLVNKSNNFTEMKERIDSAAMEFHDMVGYSNDDVYIAETLKNANNANILIPNFMDGLTDLLLENSNEIVNSENVGGSCYSVDFEENKNYWNSILSVVNCSPSGSPVF